MAVVVVASRHHDVAERYVLLPSSQKTEHREGVVGHDALVVPAVGRIQYSGGFENPSGLSSERGVSCRSRRRYSLGMGEQSHLAKPGNWWYCVDTNSANESKSFAWAVIALTPMSRLLKVASTAPPAVPSCTSRPSSEAR